MKKRNRIIPLKPIKINHPRNGYEKEFLAVTEWCEAQPMADWYIKSFDGLRLHATYLPAEEPKRIVLLSHGYKGSRFGSIAHMAEFLHENGCSILFIDQRCCGESGGRYITFGAKEQYDILRWLRLLHKKNKERLPIYLYGQSMGAASVIMASGHRMPDEVKGIIADCSFHSMRQQFRDMASGWFHIHFNSLILLRIDLICRLFAGYRMKDADTTKALLENTRPVLFFHGEEDTFVLPYASKMNYKICRAPKELVMVPGARHLCSSYVAPELYKKKLTDFFGRCDA